jgi:death-on-curing protein
MPEFLTVGDILESHAQQIKRHGGSDGIRDVGLLESAIAQPECKFGGEYLHADIFEIAAAYLFHLVKNHPLIDGNKRIGLEAALVFLEINGHSIDASDEELVELVLQTVVGKLSKPQIAEFFRTNAE